MTSPSCSSTPISYEMKEFWQFAHKYGPNCILIHCACAKRLYFYFRSKNLRWSNFGDLATSKVQIAYFLLRMRETAKFYFRSKIWRHHRVRRPRFPIRGRNFGDSAINMRHVAYFSLRMRKEALFLLPVKNLRLPSCFPTPISYKTREFWRYVNILGRYCVFHICMDFQDLGVINGDVQG